MRYAVLTLAFLFGILSVIACMGLGWRFVGWSIAGAFQNTLHIPGRSCRTYGTRDLERGNNYFHFLRRAPDPVLSVGSPGTELEFAL